MHRFPYFFLLLYNYYIILYIIIAYKFQNKQLENLNLVINKQDRKISKMKNIQKVGLGTIAALIIGLICK